MDPENRQTVPEVKEGYGHDFYPVRWKAYSPKSEQYRKGIKGRWQRMNEYAGWENCSKPSHIHQEVFDADAAAARIAALEAEMAAARRCPLCGGRTQEIAVKVKPLVWEAFGTMAFIAEAPLFGRLRVEQFGRGNTWTVCFSVPGYSDTFLEGEWPDSETAKAAGQAEYERRILSAIEAAPVKSAQPATTAPFVATYRNYRGEVSERTITPKRVWYGSTEWHPEPGWLLTAHDHDKGADRDFALADFSHARPSVAEGAKIRDLTDEVEMAEARLVHFCNEVNAGNRQGGAREFLRQVDSQFRSIRDALRALAGEDGQHE